MNREFLNDAELKEDFMEENMSEFIFFYQHTMFGNFVSMSCSTGERSLLQVTTTIASQLNVKLNSFSRGVT